MAQYLITMFDHWKTSTAKVLTVISALIFLASFFLPSRLDEVGWAFFFNHINIAYHFLALSLFPIIVILFFLKRPLIAFYLSAFLILTQIKWFEYTISYLISGEPLNMLSSWWFQKFLIYLLFAFWLIFQATRNKSWKWYTYFLSIVLFGLFFITENNCRVQFYGDVGIVKNNLRVWFENCAMVYAWYTSLIMVNFAIFYEIKSRDE